MSISSLAADFRLSILRPLEQLAAQSFIEPVMSRTRATSTSREERLTSDRTETGRVSSSSWP